MAERRPPRYSGPGRALLSLALLALLSAFPALAAAEGPPASDPRWALALPDAESTPARFLAVDKAGQTLFVMRRHSPLAVDRQFPCSTGQREGDKLKEGDLRTPEGVYFVERRVADRLDYDLYGDQAFALNFPNPVDRIKGKTGHGIWIHGRNGSLGPQASRGCVVLAAADLSGLSPAISDGLPVVIAGRLAWPPDPRAAQAAADMAERARQWAQALERRSESFFAFYDPERFSKADDQGFARFQAEQLRLFRRNAWLRIQVSNVRAMPGPDYWVTTFDCLRLGPDILDAGGMRLYWQQDTAGAWRIVGREAAADGADIESDFLGREGPAVLKALETWVRAWRLADVEAYAAAYAEDALQDAGSQERRGREAIRRHKQSLWKEQRPAWVEISPVRLRLARGGIEASFGQDYRSIGGFADAGIKTLTLVPRDERWVIARERWSR